MRRCLLAVFVVLLPIGVLAHEPVAFYKLRFEFSSTSDHSTIHIDSRVLQSKLVSTSGDVTSHNVGRDAVWIVQDLATAGEEMGIVFETAVLPEAFRAPFEFRIQKGHIGMSRVRIVLVLPDEERVLGEWEHDGVVDDNPDNVAFVFAELGEVLEEEATEVPWADVPKAVLAFYEASYEAADWADGNGWRDRPAQPYGSGDATAIARQIDEARSAGIDGFIVSWDGTGSRSAQNLATVLDVAAAKSFVVGVRVRTLAESGEPMSQAEVTQDLIRLLLNHGQHPGFLSGEGRPAVFLADSTAIAVETWANVFRAVQAQGLDGFFLAESDDDADADVFDGLYAYRVTDADSFGRLVRRVWARPRYRHLFAATPRVMLTTATAQPGYDDGFRAIDRQAGETLRARLRAAVFPDPDWILVSSWNQYAEGTHIEPSEMYGEKYLQFAREGLMEWEAVRPLIFRTGMVNAASYQHNVSAPGEIVTLFGEGIGPPELCTMEIVDGRVSTELCETEVRFRGVPAPIIYASDRQTSAVVPLSMEGSRELFAVVVYRGVRSYSSAFAVTKAVPGVFTLDASGRGAAAALHWPDYSTNSPGNPAIRGSTVMVYMTSGGLTQPAGEDGRIVTGIEELELPVQAVIGGVEAEVSFAGGAPGLITGVLQVNVRIPDDAPVGDAVTLEIYVGGMKSQDGVTLAVR